MAAGGFIGLVIVTLLVLDNRQVAWPFAAGMAASFAGVSIVVAAVFLPRFVVWLVPLAALLAARTVQRRPWAGLALLALLATLAWPLTEVLHASTSNRDVARAALDLRSAGEEVCTADYYWEEYYAYGDFPQTVSTDDCTLVIVRRSDLANPEVDGLGYADIEGVDDVCFAGEPAVLRRHGFRPGSCTS